MDKKDPQLGIRLPAERKAAFEAYCTERGETATAVINRHVSDLLLDHPDLVRSEFDAASQAAYAACVSGGNVVQTVLALCREQGFRSPLRLLLRLVFIHLDLGGILDHYAQLGTAGGKGLSQSERAWQDKLSREPEHVRAAAAVLSDLSTQFLARLRVETIADDYGLDRVFWWIDPRVLKGQTPEGKPLKQLIAAGYLDGDDDQARNDEFRWVPSV